MTHSPVEILLTQLIKIQKKKSQSLYLQAAQQIIHAIQRKYLLKGTKLPSTRKLSTILKMNRNTAVAIYAELAAQGWVEIVPNKGTYILENSLKTSKRTAIIEKMKHPYTYAKTTGYQFQYSFNLETTAQITSAKYSISDGKPDVRLHPVNEFTRWYSAAMKRKTIVKRWNELPSKSTSLFHTQLCNYLNATRGFHINSANIISTRSTEMSLYIVSQILLKKDDIVLVGNLSNYAANMIFQEAGASIKTIPIDSNGLNINELKKQCTKHKIRCVYVCAHRDYPTTVKLSTERRLALVALAKEYKFAIIEDDYAHDFQFDGSGMLPMATADTYGNIIYLGKLGQSLFPSFQTGFVVAPENLISEAKNYLHLLDKQGDLIQEQMLTELISEGEIYRLMKKNNVIYKERRNYFCKLLTTFFSEIAYWKIPSGGLAIWLEFEPKISLIQLAEAAHKNNIYLPKTILYQNKDTCAIRFGFGDLTLNDMEPILKNLKKAYNSMLKNND